MDRVSGPVNTNLESGGLSSTITGTTNQGLLNSNNRISSNAKDKNKIKGWAMIREVCKDIHIHKQVQQDAIELFSLVEENEKLKGKKMYSKVASCIMIASRKSQLPKNMKDILKGANITKKELSRCYNLILRKVCPNMKTSLKPSQCIGQIASRLSLSGEVEENCKKVAEILRKQEHLTGRSPYTIAGVAVYLITQTTENYQKSFKDISVAVKLADATIRSAYKILYPFRYEILDKLVPKEVIDKMLPKP